MSRSKKARMQFVLRGRPDSKKLRPGFRHCKVIKCYKYIDILPSQTWLERSTIRDSSPPAGGGRARKYMFFIYAFYNKKHNKIYIGQTENLEERLELHREKLFSSSFTARLDGNWNLIYQEQVHDRAQALKREKQLKSYRGREFIKQYI